MYSSVFFFWTPNDLGDPIGPRILWKTLTQLRSPLYYYLPLECKLEIFTNKKIIILLFAFLWGLIHRFIYFFSICGQVLDMVKTRCAWAAHFYKVQVRVDFFLAHLWYQITWGNFFFCLYLYTYILNSVKHFFQIHKSAGFLIFAYFSWKIFLLCTNKLKMKATQRLIETQHLFSVLQKSQSSARNYIVYLFSMHILSR